MPLGASCVFTDPVLLDINTYPGLVQPSAEFARCLEVAADFKLRSTTAEVLYVFSLGRRLIRPDQVSL